jgi:hypothetical protein
MKQSKREQLSWSEFINRKEPRDDVNNKCEIGLDVTKNNRIYRLTKNNDIAKESTNLTILEDAVYT